MGISTGGGGSGGGNVIRQVFEKEVTGTTFDNVGAIYLTTGSISGRILAGATTVGPDAGIVEIRRETGGSLILTVTATGLVADRTVPATPIPADDWYNVRLSGNGVGIIGVLKGLELTQA